MVRIVWNMKFLQWIDRIMEKSHLCEMMKLKCCCLYRYKVVIKVRTYSGYLPQCFQNHPGVICQPYIHRTPPMRLAVSGPEE